MIEYPKIPNTPGLTWRRRRIVLDGGGMISGWEGRWRPRTDLVTRGYCPTPIRLWLGVKPSEVEAQWISDACVRLQDDMLLWAKGGLKAISDFNGTLRSLAACYQSDPDSPYRKIRTATRRSYDACIRRIVADRGSERLDTIKGKTVLRWHAEWQRASGVAQAHSLVGTLRILFGFGATIVEDSVCNEQCERLCAVMHKMKFEMSGARTERLTAEQATAVRGWLRANGRPSMAIAQAFQFECAFRQKDVIGEWVPLDEPGISEIGRGNDKWLRGIRWSEIDDNLILRHKTSKRGKDVEINLRQASMVIDELRLLAGLGTADELTRARLPAGGPIVVCEKTGLPWLSDAFRKMWRKAARAMGIPDEVFNMDSRAGAITEATEATDAGAELEHVRHLATHSNIAMTQRYSRGGAEKTANVMALRVTHRNKGGTK